MGREPAFAGSHFCIGKHMQTAYVVVPFERVGARVGARQAMICVAQHEAFGLAQQLAQQVPGVAVIVRTLDPRRAMASINCLRVTAWCRRNFQRVPIGS
jgi:hypothetical protein